MPTLHLVLDVDCTGNGKEFQAHIPHGHHIIAARVVGYHTTLTTALQVNIPWLRPMIALNSASGLERQSLQFPKTSDAFTMSQEVQVVDGAVDKFVVTTDVDPSTTHIWIEYVTGDHY